MLVLHQGGGQRCRVAAVLRQARRHGVIAGVGFEAIVHIAQADILDCFECWKNGHWYEPPVHLAGLAKSFNVGVRHSSAIHFKANVLASTLIPSKYLLRDAFKRMALDFLTFGNAYMEDRPSRSGKALAYQHALAKYMRRGVDLDKCPHTKGTLRSCISVWLEKLHFMHLYRGFANTLFPPPEYGREDSPRNRR